MSVKELNVFKGAYSITGKTGSMAAGLGALSPIFSFQWDPSTANAKAFIDRINFSLASLGTGFAAGVGYIEAIAARSFTLADYGGVVAPAMTSATPSGSGGTLGAASYYYVVTAIGPWGESVASAESTPAAVISGSTGSVAIVYGTTPNATGYRVYRGTATGVYTTYFDDAASPFTDVGAAGTLGSPGTVPPAGGLTLTTNNAKRLTAFYTTQLGSALLSTTSTLTAGTRTLDAQAFGAVQFGVSTATNTVHLPSRDGDIWRSDPDKFPQVLTEGEGFILRATVPATGVWQGLVTVEWREVIG